MGEVLGPILVVDDDQTSREAMAELLRDEGFDVVTAADGVTGLALATRTPPALIVSDVRMPRGDGLQMVAEVRARLLQSYVPILLISAMDDPERIASGLELGADDFISKPVDPRELIARVKVHLRYARREHELERRAVADPLTGVLNRRGIFAVLRREHERVRRSGAPLSVLVIDIDQFKALNDALGHQAGDTALRQLAAALLRSVRAADQVGRIGGDEFLIVLPDADDEAALAMAGRLRAMRAPTVGAGTESRDVRVSVGAATLRIDEPIDALVARADSQMYRIKRTSELPILRTAEPGAGAQK